MAGPIRVFAALQVQGDMLLGVEATNRKRRLVLATPRFVDGESVEMAPVRLTVGSDGRR
jgi:hypothetical protein